MDSTVLCLLSKGGKTWIMKNCMELVVSTKVAAVGAMRFMALFAVKKRRTVGYILRRMISVSALL